MDSSVERMSIEGSAEQGSLEKGNAMYESAEQISFQGSPDISSTAANSETSPSQTGSGRKRYTTIDDMDELPAKMKLLLQKLRRFYQANNAFLEIVLPIIRDKNPLALRDIDWLVTNYSKAFPVVYQDPNNKTGEPFNIHESYLQHEDVWKKRLFDPFQRGPRINFEANGEKYETTVAQLNFFSWAIEHGVIEWATRHRENIRRHHHETKDARKVLIKAEPNREKKRMRLTNVDSARCVVYVKNMSVSLANGNVAPAAKQPKIVKKKPKNITQEGGDFTPAEAMVIDTPPASNTITQPYQGYTDPPPVPKFF